jgi:hypothetical protein
MWVGRPRNPNHILVASTHDHLRGEKSGGDMGQMIPLRASDRCVAGVMQELGNGPWLGFWW